jgi:hypothetical protein
MIDAVSNVDADGDGKTTSDEKSYEIEVQTARANGYVIDDKKLVYDKDGKIVGYKGSDGETTTNIWDVAKDKREVLWG